MGKLVLEINYMIILQIFLIIASFSNGANNKSDSKIRVFLKSQINMLDTCHLNDIKCGINTSKGIFTKGGISLKMLNEELELVVFSVCKNKKFEVKGFRIVGIAGKDVVKVINVIGSKINNEIIKKLKILGSKYKLYFEEIKALDNNSNCSNILAKSFYLNVK